MRKKTGYTQLADFEDVVEAAASSAYDRQSDVRERIVDLESELTSLRTLLRKLEAASITP